MDVNWSKKLDEVYRAHQANIEYDLCEMVQSFVSSVDESLSKENQIRCFFESLCHTVSNICSSVRVKYMGEMMAQQYNQASIENSPEEGDYGHITSEPYNDDEIAGVHLADERRNSNITQSDWSPDVSVQDKPNMYIPTETIGGIEMKPSSTPMVSELDIDRFLDYQRTRIDNAMAKKRKGSEELYVFPAKKRNLSIDSKQSISKHKSSPPVKSEQNLTIESTSNEDHSLLKMKEAQISSDAASKLRSITAPMLEAEINDRNQVRAICYFCEHQLEMSFYDWTKHILKHTREDPFYCTGCHTGLPKYKAEHCAQYKTISSVSGGNMTAFICNTCNYVQLNMNRAIDHIMADHMKSEEEAEDSMEKVILIPDLRRVPRPITRKKHKYVPNKYLYRCGVKGCNAKGNSMDQFTIHFMYKHLDVKAFVCPHCNEIITNGARDTKSFIDDILKHFENHGDLMNQCTICNNVYFCDYKAIQHIMNGHANDSCNYHRELRAEAQLQGVVILFECHLCNARFERTNQAVQHYLKCHNSHHADFKLIQLVKKTNHNNVMKFSMVEMEQKLLFQKHFVCVYCDEFFVTKSHLIRHHNTGHRSSELNIKFSTNYLTGKSYSSRLVDLNSNFDQYLIYSCGNCNDQDQLDCRFYADVYDVYSHWFDNHTKKENSKPFRFMAAQLAQCHYCTFISTFDGLKIHHAEEHPMEQFAIRNLIDPSKCGLCLDDYRDHFESDHKKMLKANLFSPIALDDDTLNKLRNVKGHKKYKCQHCGKIFETKTDFKYHHARKHPLIEAESKKFYDNESIHLICGRCEETIKPNELIDHLNAHDFSSKSRLEKYYWKTQVVCGNGLMLNKHNLLGTQYDDSNQLYKLIKAAK